MGFAANTTNAAGVLGESTGSGPSIFGNKNSAGSAGQFINNASRNAYDIVLVSTNGTGAALRTKNAVAAGANNIGILIEDGHLASISANPPTIGTTACTSCSSASLQVHSNDIAGTFAYNMSGSYGANYSYTITFNKPYRKKPMINITPSSAVGSSGNYYVTIVGVVGNYTGFTVTWPTGVNGGTGLASYNYMVIESSN